MEENQVYSDNIGKLYRDAVSRGMKADEQTFRNYLAESDENRRKVYNDLVARGMKADENQFFEYIGYPIQQPAPRVDVSDVEAAQQPQAPAMESPENGTEQAGIPTVTMDEADKVAQQPLYDIPTELTEENYLNVQQRAKDLKEKRRRIEAQLDADTEMEPLTVSQKQELERQLRGIDDEMKGLGGFIDEWSKTEGSKAYLEKQKQKVGGISKAVDDYANEIHSQRVNTQIEKEKGLGFWGRLGKSLSSAENPITNEVVEAVTNPEENGLRAARNELRNAKKQLQREEMRQNGELKGLAFVRGLETANYYELTPVIGLADAAAILDAKQALAEGRELTKAQQLLLDAMEARAGVDFAYEDNNTMWERLGKTAPEQLMFTLQFVIGAGLTGATKYGERVAAKQAEKYVARYADNLWKKVAEEGGIKAASRYAEKAGVGTFRNFIGTRAVPILEGMATAATMQTFGNPLSIASMAEDFEKRYAGDIYYDKQGNLHVFDNDRSAGQAAYQAIASAWIENFTEYAGENITKSLKLADSKMFDLAGKFDNVMKRVGAGKIQDVFSIPKELGHLTQIHSAPEEFLEEELGSVMNALFATDAQRGETYGDAFKRTVSQSFSGEQQLETLLSCTITSMLLGGGGNAVNAVGNAAYRKQMNKDVEQSKALLGKVRGIDIAGLDSQIENGQISDIASYLKEQSDANGWSMDEQGAAVSYVMNKARQMGMRHNDETAIEQAQQEMRKQAEDMANRWDGNIYNATWKDNEGNEQPVTIVNGRVHYSTNEDGSIRFDPYMSSGMIAVRLSDGTKKQVPSRTITGIQSVMSVDEQLEAQEQTIPQMMQAQFEQEGMLPTVESVWGGNLVSNETQLENGKYTYLGQDQNGLYAFANNDKKTQKDNPIVYMTERQLVEYGLSLNIQAANTTGDTETAQQAQDDLDFMQHLDELTAEATEKDQWDIVKSYAQQQVKLDQNGEIVPDASNAKAAAAYLLAVSEGSFENAIGSIDQAVAAIGTPQQTEATEDAATNAEMNAAAATVDADKAIRIDFYGEVRRILTEMQAGQMEAKVEDAQQAIENTPVSQMEVGQEFPVVYDGQQAVAVVVGKDADGRNVLTIRDQEGNDLESGIDDWTDEQWERFRVRPEEATAEPQQEGTEPEAEGIEQQPTETKQDVPENEQQEEVPVSPAQQTFDGLVQKYGDKAGHKIDVTAEDKSKTLDKAKKALEKAQTDYDDAPIGKEEKAEAALQKAQEEYNTALAEKQEWDEVKSVKDRFVAEQIAAKQAAEEERHAQAVAEEEARRAEEERKAREREATGANNVAQNIREKWEGASRVEGNADEITLANGERIAGHYVLVESGAASASHDALNGFAKTEGFPLDENEQSVNDRDYERDQNAQQITRQIANEYDSRALQDPVVVSQDGVVLSGNGRTMAGEIASAQNTDGAYIDYLKKYAPKYGFTPEQVEGMAHPRVVFVPDASMPYTAETFAKFNQQEMKGQSKTEQAVKLGKLVDDATFGRIIRSINRFDTLGDFYADTNATADAIGELLKAGAINQMQHTEMFDGDAISAQGREILENMLIGKAFESNPDAVRQLAAYKSLRQSVITALAEISNNIALGEYSLESELSDAIALAYNARKNGYKAGDAVSEFARQGKLFETEEDATAADYTNATVLMLADVMNDNRVTRLKKVLSIYNQQAEQSAAGQTDLFAEGIKTQQDILNEVLLLLQHGTESEQQQALDEAREQRKAAAEQGTGVEENGDTGESDTAERGAEETNGGTVEEIHVPQVQEAVEEIDDDGVFQKPDVELERIRSLRQALADGYANHDKEAIQKAVDDLKQYVSEGLDTDGYYSEEIDDYDGDDPMMLAERYITHLYQDRYLDDDEDQEYIRTGLRSDVPTGLRSEENAETEENRIESAKKSWENLCNPKEITNFANDSQKQAEWVDAHFDEIVEAYIAANGNKLDPDELRKAFTAIGYDGTNVTEFKEQTKRLTAVIFDRLVKTAIESGNPNVTILTGVGGAGKSTATKQLDLSQRGVVFDSALNSFGSLEIWIKKSQEAGIADKDIQVVAVHNDALTAFNNTVDRGVRTGRFLALKYFADDAFSENQGKIEALRDRYPNVEIICYDNSGNKSKKVDVDEAVKWDYTIDIKLLNQLLDVLENGINEGRFTANQAASIGRGLRSLERRGTEDEWRGVEARIERIEGLIRELNGEVLRPVLRPERRGVVGHSDSGQMVSPADGEVQGLSELQTDRDAEEAGLDVARGYTITPAQYTTKTKGKVLDMHLVKFDKELTKEQQRAANALARDLKGWWSREDGGFMMRDEATAQQLVDAVLEESGDTLEEAAPLSLADLRGETEQSKPTDEAVAAANEEVDTNPTEAQKEAGNYKKGHVTIDGFDISIENPAGSTRSGTDAQGNPWSVTMHNSYGYIRMTEGVDGDHIDIFLSDHIDDWNGTVYVVDQVNEDGSFDEHKVMYGFNSAEEAREAYLSNYSEGWQGLGTITGVSREEFKKWVDSSHRKTKAFADYKSIQTTEGQNEGPKQVSVEGLIGDLYSKGEAKLSDHVVEEAAIESQPEGTEQQPTTSTYGASNKIVSQSRYEELKRRMQEKLGGQMNMGIDPEILAIGTEMAVYHIEAGARKFADFCKNMVADLGDAIRPYLKSFYNAVRDLPEVEEAGYLDELTPYEEVKSFDVNGFDKGGSTFVETAQEAVKENEVAQQAQEATEKLKQQRKERKQPQQKKKVVSSQPSLFGEETETETKPQDNGLQRNDVGSSEGLQANGNQSAINPEGLGETEREEGGRADRGGQRDSSPVTGRPAGRVQELRNTHNNHAERGTDYAPKGVDARIEANIKAIELMQQLIESGEQATPEQMAVLRQFSGWGGLGKAFQENGYGYGSDPTSTSKRLRELLGDEAYEQANMSRNSAYYTPAEVIDTLWDIARAMGFKGGNVLEGSAGIGNIIGLMPTDMSQQSSIHAVEIDQTTGNILSLLYPDAKVEVQGFEATQVENGSVDLAITNVPFVTGLRVNDTTGDKDLSRRFHDIHDFCIAKNIRKLREGGIGIFITSSGTLDNSAKLREWIVNEGGADVVGAFRMNNATFGGTGVTSDIIVVRKRVNGKKSQHAIDVAAISGERVAEYDTGETKKVKGQEVRVVKQLSMDYNKYFIEHPEMMAGEMQFGFERGETFRPTSKALYPTKDKDQNQMLADFVRSFEGKEWEAALATQQTEQANVYEELGADVKEGSMLVNKDGVLCVAQRGKAVPLEVNANKVKGHTKVECFNAYQAIKQALADVLSYQTENESDDGLQPLLDKLNKAFDSFVKTYGNLHKNTSITFLKGDVDWPNILALEKYSESNNAKGERVQSFGKTDIFSKRVVEKEKEPEPKNVKDGIIASIYMFGRVDVPYISEHIGMSEEEVREEIVKEGLGFENPATRQMEVIYEYLSGNVREKLQQAKDNNTDGRYDANIKALERVIPMNIPAHLIDFTIGSSWVDPKLYEEYVKERTDIDVRFTAAGGTWFMKAPNWVNAEKNRAMGVVSEMLHKTIMGTQLIEAAMQNKTITVSETRKKYDGTTETTIDREATQACAAKIDEIRQDFKDWARAKMQSDPEMSERMGQVYNELFNNYVPKEIPEEFAPLRFSGMASVVKGKPFSMNPHQAKAAIRATTQPLLLAHEVGSGKTITLIATAMEMRRLGTAKKPMIVVQNSTVGQFVESAKQLYPNAKVLTIEEADRTVEGRKNFYAKIKYNDWDMIVVPQSVFERIPDSEERQMAYVQDKIEEKLMVLEQMRDADDSGNNMIVRQAEREISQLEDQLAGLSEAIAEKRKTRDAKKEAVTRQNAEVKALEMLDRQTDDVENFDDMGIDAILVDEAHEYKHLGFATAMQRGVKGVDPSYSKKAQGVFLKAQAVMEKNNGRNVVFATGTPISNTAAEIWTFMRYLMPADTMKQYGIYYFDDFVRNFGNLQQMLEFTTSGKFKENNRFAGYVNLPELVRIWSGVSDTVLNKDIEEERKRRGGESKIPEMEGGKAQDIYLPQTKALRAIMKYVKGELERFEKMSGKDKKANSHIPLVMYGIAKAAAVDARLVDETAEDDSNSKTNEAVRQTLRSLEETKDYRGTVAIFADNYQNKVSGFNIYEDIRKKLIEAGVPESEVVVMKSGMSDKKKLEIFDKVKKGEIRVILGSTFTLGTGVNIQDRLHTLIHLDAPNRPMDYTQRNGRILRQGNMHKVWGIPVRVLRFGVEDSLDVTAYQRLKTKGAIADSIMHGKDLMLNSMENRVMEEEEDVFGDTVAQLSGSEYAMLKNQAEKELRKLQAKRKQWEADQTYVHNRIPRLQGSIRAAQRRLEEEKGNLEKLSSMPEHPTITIGKHTFKSLEDMADFIKEYNAELRQDEAYIRGNMSTGQKKERTMTVNVGGIDFKIHLVMSLESVRKGTTLSSVVKREMTYECPALGMENVPVHQMLFRNALEDILTQVVTGVESRDNIESAQRVIERDSHELEQLKARDGKPFEFEAELKQASERLEEYTAAMKKEMEEKEAKYADMDSEVEAATGLAEAEEAEEEETPDLSIREEEPPVRTGIGYKVFVLKDGKLYPPMVANPNGEATPVGVWLDADAAPIAGESKTGRPQVKAGGKGTQGGSGQLAYRPGWHLGTIPYAIQFNRKDENGEKTLFPKDFVWAEVEYADDVDYQQEAESYGVTENGKYRHSYAGLPRVPKDGSYTYRTNPNPETDPWIITGAMKVKRILTPSEVDAMVIEAGREPQRRESGAVTDEEVNYLNGKADDAQSVAYDAVREALANAGIDVVMATTEDVEKLKASVRSIEDSKGVVRGWVGNNGKIYLTKDGMTAETPIHEYTHLWAEALQMENPELWEQIKDLLKDTPEWKRIASSVGYKHIRRNEDRLAGEVLAHISGKKNAERMEAEAKRMIDEAPTLEEAAKAANLLGRMRDALKKFWTWVGKTLLGKKGNINIDQVSNMVLADLTNGVDPFNPNRGKRRSRKSTDVDLSIAGPDNAIAGEYNRTTGYNSEDVSGYVRVREELLRSFFDGLRPLEQMQQLVEKALGRKLRDSENAYGLATLLPSLNKAMMDKAETEFMLPVLRKSAHLIKSLMNVDWSRKEAQERLNNYLLAKHGLERNEWFHQQALANDPNAEEEDKAGLRGLAESLGRNPDDYKAVAEDIVSLFESYFDATEIDDYWATMKALTDRMLEISYESGMINKDTFESLKARHKYYVPLRGFADGTSGDLFDYVSRHPHFQSVFKKMKGRKSKADDPLANLYNMLQSAIVIGNNNKVMQNIYNLAVNAKSDLLRVNRSWYEQNANGDWEEKFPDIPEDATADEIDAIMKQFDADMQQLKQQGKAAQYLNKMDLGKRVLSYQAKEHEMTAYINGRKVVMHVAGNPLVAQQLNKANSQQLGWFAETVQGLTRFASRINTSLSPAFMFTNAARDIGFALYSATVTGGLKKNMQMVGNLFRAGWVLPRLILTGKMGGVTKMFSPTDAAKIEQWWNEFVDNGGETGFTNTLSAEKAKGQVDDMLRRMVNYNSKDGQSRLKKATFGVIETMGRYSEDISRFAAYCLKRAEGETVKASVNEAKNVTVNFNVKGGGNSMVARFVAGCRSCYSFFNAALQGINRMGRLAKENPKAFAACLTACVVQGAMLPWLNMALFALLGGDDDDWEKYEMLTEYTANHNLIIFVGNHKFLKIPYSQELAPFASMGNIWFRQQMGWNHGRSIASQIGNMFLDLAPVNIGESKTTMGKLAKTATPTILMPVTEWMLNENFTAAPIEKRYEWNKFDSGWEKAYESRTSKWLIDATRYLDEKTNGKIDINPSFVEHIATGMLGGIGRSGDNLMKYFSDGFQTQNAPYLRTIMFDSKQQGYIGAMSREYGRLAYEVLPEVKHDVDRADMLEFARLANTQDYQIANVVSIYKTGKDLLGNKTSFQGIDKLEKAFKKAQKESDGSESANEYLQAMRDQINEMKMEMLDAVNQVIYEHSGEGRKGRIDRVREIEKESKEKYQE